GDQDEEDDEEEEEDGTYTNMRISAKELNKGSDAC
ncbi:MAG: hypothetical protein EZS28_050515, partial [Streblomastix strix]